MQLRHVVLAVFAAWLILLGLAGTASGRGRTTLVVGYVSAGGPVSGARLIVYGPSGRRLKLRRRTDSDGFFVLALPGRPSSVRLVASGGIAGAQRIDGSLQAIVPHPGLADDAFISPASTVIAAYAARHPRAWFGLAVREGRRLLSLGPSDSTGQALLNVTPYFDGRSFLQRSRAHGSLQRYVTYLIRRGKPASFRGPGLPRGIEDYARVLGMANNAVGVVKGIGSLVNDVIGWAQGSQQKIGEIWNAVQRMENQLNAIQTSLAGIRAEIQRAFDQMQKRLKVDAYNHAVLPVKRLAGVVQTTETDFRDLLNNATSPEFDAEVARSKTADIEANIRDIKNDFNDANDLFRDALISGGALSTTSAYHYAGEALQANSADFMTSADSSHLRDFANYVLQYQALAFNLIVRWETHRSPHSPNEALKAVLARYLGSVEDAKAWWDANNPPGQQEPIPPSAPPSSGDLHDELTYVATIRAVPAHTIVDAKAADETTRGTGMMWQSSELRHVSASAFDFGEIVHVPRGLDCGEYFHLPYDQLGKQWCQYMWNAWVVAQSKLTDQENLLRAATGLTDWGPANAGLTRAVLSRAAGSGDVLQVKPYYWTPDGATFLKGYYHTDRDGHLCDCGYTSDFVDRVSVETIEGSTQGKTGSCAFGVGEHRGTDCRPVYALLGRKPDRDEQYWP